MSDFVNNFRSRLNQMEEASGLSEKAFADFLGIKLTTYRNIKGGGAQGPALATLSALITKLGNDKVMWLITGQGDEMEDKKKPAELPLGRDWIRMPDHNQGPLSAEEREQLERTITVLRCPAGCDEAPREAILPNINTFYKVTKRFVRESKANKKGKVNNG